MTTTKEIQTTAATWTSTAATDEEALTDIVIKDFKIQVLDDLIAKSLNSTKNGELKVSDSAAFNSVSTSLRHGPAWTTFVLVALIGVLVVIIIALIFTNRR
jgi:hypothetical protein